MQTDIIILEKEKKKKQKKASTKVGGNLQKVLNVKWSLCWAVTYLKLVSFNQQARNSSAGEQLHISALDIV